MKKPRPRGPIEKLLPAICQVGVISPLMREGGYRWNPITASIYSKPKQISHQKNWAILIDLYGVIHCFPLISHSMNCAKYHTLAFLIVNGIVERSGRKH